MRSSLGVGRKLAACALLAHAIGLSDLSGQERVYKLNTAEEDWSFLKDPEKRIDFWDPVKYIPLNREDRFLTLGGEMRMRPEGFHVRSTEAGPGPQDTYLLQRYLFNADLHLGKRFRVFTELQSGIINGKLNAPRPTDEDALEAHQAFFEYRSSPEEERGFAMRIGRQEVSIGSSRLISARAGLNVKRSFDGAAARYRMGNWVVHGATARLVKIKKGLFDDPPDPGQTFWGGDVVRGGLLGKGSIFGTYYLGIRTDQSQYVQGSGPETRHTIGVRLAGTNEKFEYTCDVIYQWGHFVDSGIRAWAVSTSGGYRVGRGRFGLSANAASGDKDPSDSRLESFNPLFPGNAYSGLVGLFGPTNIADVTPSYRRPLRRNVLLIAESPFYLRVSVHDGLYNIERNVLLPGQSNANRFVGANPGVLAVWQVGRHLALTGMVTRFFSGGVLDATFVENGFAFYSSTISYRF